MAIQRKRSIGIVLRNEDDLEQTQIFPTLSLYLSYLVTSSRQLSLTKPKPNLSSSSSLVFAQQQLTSKESIPSEIPHHQQTSRINVSSSPSPQLLPRTHVGTNPASHLLYALQHRPLHSAQFALSHHSYPARSKKREEQDKAIPGQVCRN